MALAGALGAPVAIVGFTLIIVTQLAQTVQVGHGQGTLSPSVAGAIAGSCGLAGLALGLPPLRRFLGLAAPTPVALALVAGGAPAAVAISSRLPSEPAQGGMTFVTTSLEAGWYTRMA